MRGERAGLLSHEIVQDAPGDVVDIQRALAQVGVVDFAEGFRVPVGDLLEDVLDVVPLLGQRPQHLVDEGSVLDDQQMRVEYAGVLGADGLGDPLLHLEDLRAGLDQRGFEPRDLGGNLGLRDSPDGRLLFVIGPIDEYGAAGDARGDTDAVEALFCWWDRVAHGECADAPGE